MISLVLVFEPDEEQERVAMPHGSRWSHPLLLSLILQHDFTKWPEIRQPALAIRYCDLMSVPCVSIERPSVAEILPHFQDETLKCSMSLKVTQEAVTDLCIESRMLLDIRTTWWWCSLTKKR